MGFHTMSVAALLLLASSAGAQGSYSSSESYVTYSPVNAAGAHNDVSSTNFQARITVGLPAGKIASNLYAAVVGTGALTTTLSDGPPRVFGLSPGVGSKDGSEPFALHGFNLEDGSSTANVLIGGKSASSVAVTTNTVLTGVTGEGLNSLGNPLGPALVRVTNGNGIGFGEEAYVYSPALVAPTGPHIGQGYALDLHLPAGSFHTIAFGSSLPGVGIPVFPLAGSLEVVTGFKLITPLESAPSSIAGVVLPVPNQPGLVGALLELQGIVLTSVAPVGGTFTNRLAKTIGG